MAKVSLRGYNTEIDRLIDNNQLDEAIAHCIHILGIFPKHADTYRLLGKAFLERQRYNDAADMFLRVLAIFPDDFVAHIGISIVREELSELNLAVFHMERAFEVQPTNTAIQDELKRLYSKRDGVAPAKIRLTHPALARLYTKGDLIQQALGELSVALSDAPSRPDILAQLAELYTREGQNTEAIETCNKLIERLPYCYGALNVLTRLLPGTPFAQDAPIYQARINELDPYYEFKENINEAVGNVPEDAVMIEPLVWSPDSELVVNKSDWASSLGLKLVEPQQVDPAFIQKKAPVASYTQDETPTVPRARQSAAPIIPPSITIDAAVTPASNVSEPVPSSDLPEWMQTAGWSRAENGSEMGSPILINEPASSDQKSSTDIAPTGSTNMPSIEKIQRDTDNLPELPDDLDASKLPGETDSLEPAKSIAPESIPAWVRSIAPSDIVASSSDSGPSPDGISNKAIDDAFSAIFPAGASQPIKQDQEAGVPTPNVEDQIESIQPGHKASSPGTAPLPEDVVLPAMDEEISFSLDDLRKEMDMAPEISNGIESADSSQGIDAEALDDLRKSFHTDKVQSEDVSIPEGESIEDEELPQEVPADEVIAPVEVPSEEIVPPQNEPSKEVDISQALPPETESTLQEEPAEVTADASTNNDSEIPVWLRDLGDGQTPAEGQEPAMSRDELPAWLQDFENRIEDKPLEPAEQPAVGPESATPASDQPEEKADWRMNLPAKSESKFHTQELPEIPGLDLTDSTDQYEIEDDTKKEIESEKPSESVADEPAELVTEPGAPPFSGGDTTIIAPPISQDSSDEDERPAWLSKLIGIDDVEIPAPEKSVKPTEQADVPSESPENLEEIAGAMQAAWMRDMADVKGSEAEPTTEPSPTPQETPDISAQVEAPESLEAVSPPVPGSEAEPEIPVDTDTPSGESETAIPIEPISEDGPVDSDTALSDLSKMVESLKADAVPSPVKPEPVISATEVQQQTEEDEKFEAAEIDSRLDEVVEGTPSPPESFSSEPEASEPVAASTPEAPMEDDSGDAERTGDLDMQSDSVNTEPESKTAGPDTIRPDTSPAPEATPETASGDAEGVPDLSLIVEGLQAAWLSEHVEDGEIKHTGKLRDIYVPPVDAGGSETIIIKRPGVKPDEPQSDAYQPEAGPEEPQPVKEPESSQAEPKPEPPQAILEPEPTTLKPSDVKPESSPQPVKQPSPVTTIQAEDILNDARSAYSHGVLDESIDRYVVLITRNRLIDSVIEDLESMTLAKPDQSDVWQALGDAYTRRNKLDQALSAYMKAEELLK
jgi:tetratricopeptide (TPR) repeat protein